MSASTFQVAILAGGQGTRLRARTGDLPKPMVPVRGKPLLLHQLETCARQGYTRVLLLLHYKPESIMAVLGDGAALDLHSRAMPLSNRRAAPQARCTMPFIASIPGSSCCTEDTYFDVDLRRNADAHARANADAPRSYSIQTTIRTILTWWKSMPNPRVRQPLHAYPHPENRVQRNLRQCRPLYVFERKALKRHAQPNGPE